MAQALSECIHTARNPKDLLTKLGLQTHPFLQKRDGVALHAWDVAYREVLYCNDEYTLNHMPSPVIEVTHGGLASLTGARLESDISLKFSAWLP